MRLLFDENISRKLVLRLGDLFPGSIHVSDVGPLQSPDRRIWDHAKENGLTIISTDADFLDLANKHGHPPKILWLRRWSHPNRDIEDVLRAEANRILEFASNASLHFLILDKR